MSDHDYDHLFIKMHIALRNAFVHLPVGTWQSWRKVVDTAAVKGTRKYPGKNTDDPRTPNETPQQRLSRWLEFVTYDGCEYEKVPLLAILEGAPLSVLLVIALRINRQGKCHPGLADISRLTGLDRFTVSKAILFLRMLGLISVESRFKYGKDGESNIYTVDRRFFSFGKDNKVENEEIDLLG